MRAYFKSNKEIVGHYYRNVCTINTTTKQTTLKVRKFEETKT